MLKAYHITESHVKNALEEAQQLKMQYESGNHSVFNSYKMKVEETQSLLAELKKTGQLLSSDQQISVADGYLSLEKQVSQLVTLSNKFQRDELFGNSQPTDASIDHYIDNITRSVQEGYEHGINTRNALSNQRSKLNHANNGLEEVLLSVEDSRHVVGIMKKVQGQKKLVTYVIVGLLGLAIVLILYIKFF